MHICGSLARCAVFAKRAPDRLSISSFHRVAIARPNRRENAGQGAGLAYLPGPQTWTRPCSGRGQGQIQPLALPAGARTRTFPNTARRKPSVSPWLAWLAQPRADAVSRSSGMRPAAYSRPRRRKRRA
jgi:hypothetical protein